ncbi:unnamed protein product [Didymodactylos carnosus]|uniref:EF-hand domain-containing protein n=1 Tax=Didymodactylos carnosus TaxID=1234261 RepID=A0A813RSG1_9BILA|nr:unnamed protein product [Didymodactylos carnosus]CAF0785156.1 unnamed protein product [Didymodactylos carnosus]CAF3531129.1 unnamed protein product [Didymodactylos carnosus]CAF3568821.1 unnamed protein product [Didymodactylos carnosus]
MSPISRPYDKHCSRPCLNSIQCLVTLDDFDMSKEKTEFVRAVEEAFFILDRNENRSVGTDDFNYVAKSIGLELDVQESAELLRTVVREQTGDEHSSGLNIYEYRELMLRHVTSSDLDLELKSTFQYFDYDGDGLITQHDLDNLIKFFDVNDSNEYQQIRQCVTQTGMNFQQFVKFMMHDS